MHGLRELGKEIGIIVIGVLIALGAEQTVEALHWAHQMDVHRANLKGELRDNALWFMERRAIADCESARLRTIASALAAPGDDWKAQPVVSGWPAEGVYGAPWRGFASDAWRNALATGAGGHMSSDEMLAYAKIYSDVVDMHELNLSEQLAASQISDLNHDVRLTEASRDRYRKAVDDLKFYARAAAETAQESLGWLKAMGIEPSPSDVKQIVDDRRRDFGGCVVSPKAPTR